jgi:hypothetical protein
MAKVSHCDKVTWEEIPKVSERGRNLLGYRRKNISDRE